MTTTAVGARPTRSAPGSFVGLLPGVLLLLVIGYAGKLTEQSINAYGSTFFDRGSGARFLGTWQPGWGLRLSWLFSYLDGLPYGRILPVSGLNQGLIGILATRRGPGDGSPNNSKRGAYNLAADLRLLREFRLSHGRLDATIDVFNVFNMAHQVREADVTSPVHLWRIPLSFQTPRSLQLGLRFSW